MRHFSLQGRFRFSALCYLPFGEDPRAISHNSRYLMNLIYYSTIISAQQSIDGQADGMKMFPSLLFFFSLIYFSFFPFFPINDLRYIKQTLRCLSYANKFHMIRKIDMEYYIICEIIVTQKYQNKMI